MPQEPYNLFANAGSTLPGGSAYEDLLVILKAVVKQNGGTIELDEYSLMFVDRDESLRVDDIWKDGVNHKVFSIQTKQRNQNPEGHIAHRGVDRDNPEDEPTPFAVKVIGTMLWFTVIFALVVLVAQVLRVMF